MGSPRLWLRLPLLALLAAAPTPQQLQDVERAHAADVAAQLAAAAKARAAADLEQRLGQSRVETAAALRRTEDALAQAAAHVADLTQRRIDAEARLAAGTADLAPLLPVIERLSLYPAETLLAVPMPPEDAVRGVLVLGGVARALEREAAAVRSEQAEVAALSAEMQAALPALTQAQAEQKRLADALDDQLAQAHATRRDAEDTASDAARHAAADAARADSLRAAIARIETARKAAEARARETAAADARRQDADATAARARQEAVAQPAGPGVGETHGQLTAPVAGTVVRAFGAGTEAGPASGVSYQAPPGARVVSPCGGRVVFAGPFRSFGLLMIVDCGGGYHFVLSGLDRLDAQVGQSVRGGEPVGIMPAWDPQSAGGSRPSLYLELRKDGQPVNPAPFLRARS